MKIIERYLLKKEEGGNILYNGSSWERVLNLIEPATNPTKIVWYNLLAVQIRNKNAQIVSKRMHRYRSGELNVETQTITVPINDLEKLLNDIKSPV